MDDLHDIIAELVEALEAALPILEGDADDASMDVGAAHQEGSRATAEELHRPLRRAARVIAAKDAIARAKPALDERPLEPSKAPEREGV